MTFSTKIHIVYDVAYKEFQNNKIFNHEYAAHFPGAITWAIFADKIRGMGWDISTSDVFLQEKRESDNVFCISEMISDYTFKIFDAGAKPLILICGESPNVAWRFYHKLEQYSQLYKHAILFKGAQQKVRKSAQFHVLHWPNIYRERLYHTKWDERQFAVMVASNKRRISGIGKFGSAKLILRKILWNYLMITDPVFRFDDLYEMRLKAILYFSNVQGFRLFGTGWDEKKELSPKEWLHIQRLKPKKVENKLETMSRFKFAICFENCIFPGYITEKIFDCFFSGCIPIYYGAPDIEDFIPKETFIDFREFGNFTELNEYLNGLTESEAKSYLEAAQDFMRSKSFEKFTADSFVDKLIKIIAYEF